MKQVIQSFKTGDLYIDQVPPPTISDGMVLIENRFSLISAGTERGTVKVAKASMIGKAKQRPDLVAQVLQNIQKEGLKATVSKVQTKLDSLKALGYSSSGVVMASMDSKGLYEIGDRVACAGQDYASHAEMVSIPQNLVAKIPTNVSDEEAAFTTLGAIALQGVRQANPKLGEKVCVIGLGLLGQITCQLLQANGCFVFGTDLNDDLVRVAAEFSANVAHNRKEESFLKACENFCDGMGFDSVIITAASPSNDPIELSAEIVKKKGKVVMVGAVKMDVPRDPHFYRKELELIMSCSYGPGRYDFDYEENGIDYPFAYVRWTEQRNMQAFLDLLSERKINLQALITHVFSITDAEKAYDIVLGKRKEHHIGILLQYGDNEKKQTDPIFMKSSPQSKVNIGFIGAGSFAQSYLIPNLEKIDDVSLRGVVTANGITAKNVVDKYGFDFCSTDSNSIFSNEQIDTVFIATPHSFHADLVIKALNANMNVFVEKPLATNQSELAKVSEIAKRSTKIIQVGFNRRFAIISKSLKNSFKNIGEPLVVNIRVNAGFIPREHWTQQINLGGGRIIGEVCHFIDLLQYFTEDEPLKVYAEAISTKNQSILSEDNISIVVKFKNGSIGNIVYVANGDKSLPKERIEVYGGGVVGVIDDFRSGYIYSKGSRRKLKSTGKGHKEEIFQYIEAIKRGSRSPIEFRSIELTTVTTFKILDSLATGLPQQICVDG